MSALQPSAPRHKFSSLVVKVGLAILVGMGAIIVVGALVLAVVSIFSTGAIDLPHML